MKIELAIAALRSGARIARVKWFEERACVQVRDGAAMKHRAGFGGGENSDEPWNMTADDLNADDWVVVGE